MLYKKSRYAGLWVVKGMLTGAAGILPGFSGGVMMLAFGIYEPLMEVLANPVKKIKKHAWLLLWVAIGWVAGFWLGAKLLSRLFTEFETEATCLFIGLMIGMLPPLFKDAVSPKNKKASYITIIAVTLIMSTFFMYLKYGAGLSIIPNTAWYIFCGVMWGTSLIVPGMSSSSVLMSLGLYLPMTQGISDFDAGVITPWLFGIAASVILLSKLVNFLFGKYYHVSRCTILGIVVASVISVVPVLYRSAGQVFVCILLGIAGFIMALQLNTLEKKVSRG